MYSMIYDNGGYSSQRAGKKNRKNERHEAALDSREKMNKRCLRLISNTPFPMAPAAPPIDRPSFSTSFSLLPLRPLLYFPGKWVDTFLHERSAGTGPKMGK